MSIQQAIANALKAVQRNFGKGALQALGDRAGESVPVFASGSMGLDRALGIGGIPRGRVVEVFGQESSGKTTLALHMIAQAQQAGLVTTFIDAEHALDIVYARKLGVNVDQMLVSQPDYGEQALDIACTLAPLGDVGLIVVDSVAALTPKAEIEGEMGDHHVGAHARLMSQAMRKLTASCGRAGTTLLFINQIRHKIGVMFGSPETTTGGNALKFYSSIRIEVRRGPAIKEGDRILGNRMRLKVVKNKLAPPFRQTEVDLLFGQGFDTIGELVDIGLDADVIAKAGSWYSFGETRLGQGRAGALAFLKDNPAVTEAVKARLSEPPQPVLAAAAAGDS